jgi:hypothetical protein
MTDRFRPDIHTPFIVRFAQALQGTPQCVLRYDERRQLSQVLLEGKWIDVPDAPVDAWRSTRLTKVKQDTTDES